MALPLSATALSDGPRLRHGRHTASGYLRDISATRRPLRTCRWVEAHQPQELAAGCPDIALSVLADQRAPLVARPSAPPDGVALVAARSFEAALSDARCLVRLASLLPVAGHRLPRADGSARRLSTARLSFGSVHAWRWREAARTSRRPDAESAPCFVYDHCLRRKFASASRPGRLECAPFARARVASEACCLSGTRRAQALALTRALRRLRLFLASLARSGMPPEGPCRAAFPRPIRIGALRPVAVPAALRGAAVAPLGPARATPPSASALDVGFDDSDACVAASGSSVD